jgi:hypothetical protein
MQNHSQGVCRINEALRMDRGRYFEMSFAVLKEEDVQLILLGITSFGRREYL